MGYFKDLREHIAALDKAGLLVKIDEQINKDTELMPLVRWQFRGLSEEERRAFIFTNVVDAKGRKYDIPVVCGSLAASRQIYGFGLQCAPEEIVDRWSKAQQNPIPPKVVEKAPVQEEVHMGASLMEHGALSEFPIPISTPGYDCAPFTTASHWFTKDIETGIINIGNYRGHIKSPTRTGVFLSSSNHGGYHWRKCQERGVPLPAALVIGAPPCVAYTAPSRIPFNVSELDVAGGLAGAAIEVVKCKTNDVLVPANAEIVIEGEISTEFLEPEAPFGESTGYIAEKLLNPYFEVKCVTHRKNPILATIISQMPPSESSVMRQVSAEGNYLRFLRDQCNIPGIIEVAFHSIAVRQICVIKMKKINQAHVWQALHSMVGYNPATGKMVIAVDEDINPRNLDSLFWAMAFRMQPHRDVLIIRNRTPQMDPSVFPPGHEQGLSVDEIAGSSAMLMDATRKWAYPPVSLPKKEYMERAKQLWERLELPKLQPQDPWHGYDLGLWSDEDEQDAQAAVKGDHYETGEKRAQQRVRVNKLG
ncbi:MAG: UbiD family decarboxylase [Deltaproteobacteria bacterium]|nr:UbiD family decarboxylase [Deltaproteobacteria bacterium]